MIKSKDIFSLAAAAAGIFAVFGSSIFFTAIISDDILYVSRFHQLEFSWSNLFFWLQPVMALRSPLPAYTFMLDYLIWGREFFLTGAHLGNILLHLTAAAGVFAGMRWLKFPAGAALAGTLLWALHPQRAESVAWLSERKDVLLLALTVWSIVFFIRSMQKHRFAWYVLSLLFFLLTFAVKPGAIGLPVILTAFLWGRYRSKNIGFYVKYTGVYYLISLICFLSFFHFSGSY